MVTIVYYMNKGNKHVQWPKNKTKPESGKSESLASYHTDHAKHKSWLSHEPSRIIALNHPITVASQDPHLMRSSRQTAANVGQYSHPHQCILLTKSSAKQLTASMHPFANQRFECSEARIFWKKKCSELNGVTYTPLTYARSMLLMCSADFFTDHTRNINKLQKIFDENCSRPNCS